MAALQKRIETKFAVEEFLTGEADLLDRWKLADWLALFEQDCKYEVGPLGVDDPEKASPDNTLFLISDDHFRLERRVEMLQKPSAHIEFPHSKTRHLVSNVKVLEDDGEEIVLQANFVIFRNKRGVTSDYMGHSIYRLRARPDGAFTIKSKKVYLDLDGLVPQGKVSIIL